MFEVLGPLTCALEGNRLCLRNWLFTEGLAMAWVVPGKRHEAPGSVNGEVSVMVGG